jgi:putative transposase
MIDTWAPRIGVEAACRAFGLSPRTWRHRRQHAQGRLPARPSRAKPPGELVGPSWRIDDHERDRIRAILCSESFCDLAPAQIYATLLDAGVYLCSERTMYRILTEAGLIGERRRGHARRSHAITRLAATGPNQVWSWDISRLRGPSVRLGFYLYVVLDIYSRKIVGWTIDTVESDKTAKRLIERICRREGISPDQLAIYADRGAQMTSNTIADFLENLGIARSFSGPRTSDDNPYSEAAFKTVKYRLDYPARFDSIDHARTWMRAFVAWYNHDHYPSALR